MKKNLNFRAKDNICEFRGIADVSEFQRISNAVKAIYLSIHWLNKGTESCVRLWTS